MKPHQVETTLQMGKAGLTEALVEELRAQLKKRKIVKVKLMRSAREASDLKAVAAQLAERAGAQVLDVRGGTAVFGAPGHDRGPEEPADTRRRG